MKNIYLILFSCLFVLTNGHAQNGKNRNLHKNPIKVTFIGASITYGVGTDKREINVYPAQLQKLLGENYKVFNYGISGRTMLSKGNLPYWNTTEYQNVLASEPDVVFIDLGGNDSKLINRKYLNEMESDCEKMLESFEQLSSHPRIVLLLPVVSFVQDTTGIWDPVIVKSIIPHIQQVAFKKNIEVVDIHSLLVNQPALLPDKIHPNTQGATIIAKRLYELFAQKADKSFDAFIKIKQPL